MKLSKKFYLALLVLFLGPALAGACELGDFECMKQSDTSVAPSAFEPVPYAPNQDDYISPKLEELKNKGVPENMLQRALKFFDANRDRIPNKRYLGIVDFSLNAGEKRFFFINLDDGTVEYYHVAHGKDSDDGNGNLISFGNDASANKSARGFFVVGQPYQTTQVGYASIMNGLNPGYNENSASREIMLHGAAYVTENPPHAGFSWGCFALDNAVIGAIVDKIQGGLFYADTSRDLFPG
jgi:hypothetical protein